jgi:hypothetical protein
MRATTALLALILTGVIAAPASAAPDRSGTVSDTAPSYAWDGGPGTSLGTNLPVVGGASVGNFVGCFEGIADCEDTLIKVDTAGTLTVTAKAEGTTDDAIDLYLWPSDAEGTYDDSEDDIAGGTGASATGDEKIVTKVKPGYYVAQVKFFLAQDVTYKGAAVLSGFPTPPAAPVVADTPPAPAATAPATTTEPAQPAAPAAKKKPSKRAVCLKKARKIKKAKPRKKAIKRCKKLKR